MDNTCTQVTHIHPSHHQISTNVDIFGEAVQLKYNRNQR